MKRQMVRTAAMVGVLGALAGSAYAIDDEYAKKAADTNPFYAGLGRNTTVTYEGLPAPGDDDRTKKAADTNPFYVGEGRSATVSYAGLEAPHIEKPWDKGAVGYHAHR